VVVQLQDSLFHQQHHSHGCSSCPEKHVCTAKPRSCVLSACRTAAGLTCQSGAAFTPVRHALNNSTARLLKPDTGIDLAVNVSSCIKSGSEGEVLHSADQLRAKLLGRAAEDAKEAARG
jgi:hypothetical protein